MGGIFTFGDIEQVHKLSVLLEGPKKDSLGEGIMESAILPINWSF